MNSSNVTALRPRFVFATSVEQATSARQSNQSQKSRVSRLGHRFVAVSDRIGTIEPPPSGAPANEVSIGAKYG